MSSPKWWSKDVVSVVTGSSEGIGLEIVRQLAEKGITVVSTARNELLEGLVAIELLKSQGLDVYFHPLDFSSTESVSQLASWLKRRFSGVDILINNTGIVNDEANYESVKEAIEISYEGVKRVTKGLLPIMKTSPAGSRIINISSSLGNVQYMEHNSLQEKVSNIEPLTEEKLDAFVQHFLEDVKAGVVEANDWPRENAAFVVSKVAVNAYTRLLAKSLENLPLGEKVYANGLWLGFLKTMNMNNNTDALITAEQGADTPVWLALLPPPEVPIKGHYFRVPYTGQYFKLRHFIQF